MATNTSTTSSGDTPSQVPTVQNGVQAANSLTSQLNSLITQITTVLYSTT